MRTSIVLAIVAATAVTAKDCNPSYNVAPSTDCFTACNEKAGSSIVPGWTMDHTSDKFLDSLKLMCVKTTAEYGQFMAAGGMCMVGCAGDDPELFNAEFAGACAWYAEHKDDVCADDATTTDAAGTTTTAAAGETTAIATTTTTTVASAVSSVNSAASSAVSAVQSAVSAVSSAASAASSVAAAASSSAAPSAPAANTESAASKMQMSGLAMALVAGAGYLAL